MHWRAPRLLFLLIVSPVALSSSDSRSSNSYAVPTSIPPLPSGSPRPAPSYMVDNRGNTHNAAADHGTRDGPLLPPDFNSSSSDGTDSPLHTGVNPEVAAATSWWYPNMQHGLMPYAEQGYQVFRNVKDFGAIGDGVTDDTEAINAAVVAGNRCGSTCSATTVTGAVVYFPPGTYLVSSPIIQYFYTVFVGDPITLPTIKGSSSFSGIALIDTDVYIPDGNGAEWYGDTNNFYRAIRNFNIDLTAMPAQNQQGGQAYAPTGIHWQVAQATSLQNINFNMPVGGDTTAVGIFTENGSGGFMSDLKFEGGAIGMRVGSQQFTSRNLQFVSSLVAIEMIWDWGWTWKEINVVSCYVAISCTSLGGIDDQGTGSIAVLDSTFTGVPYGITINGPDGFVPNILLDNLLVVEQGPDAVVLVSGGETILDGPASGSQVISSWAMGNAYLIQNATAPTTVQNFLDPAPSKPAGLLGDNGYWFAQSRPQYESMTADQFINVLDHGVSNAGTGDQSGAINAVLASANGAPVFFPAGVYTVGSTVFIPAGSRIVGEAWSQIMATGANFLDGGNPTVMVRVGNAGDTGSVEISDVLFTVSGSTAGCILMEWNINAGGQGTAAMWDSHFRVGGAVGSSLQTTECPTSVEGVNTGCNAASLLMHITADASAYLENVWFWVADHDIDNPDQAQISVFAARGVLIESQSPTWLYGTASEHAALYQYQLSNAKTIFLGHMQTETPYYQPIPPAPQPWNDFNTSFPNDPTFENCDSSSTTCPLAWALRIIESEDVFVYGAGFYSWFSYYGQDCLNGESCQDALIDTAYSQGLWLYDIFTKGASQAVSPQGLSAALQIYNQNGYTTSIAAWLSLALSGGDIGGYSNQPPVVYIPPSIWSDPDAGVACEPPCTIVLPPSPIDPTVVSWPPITTAVTTSGGTTSTTVILVPPFTISAIPFWPITIAPGDTADTITPVQSVLPSSIVITLPSSVTLVPTSSGIYHATPDSTTQTVGGVETPTWYSSSHAVTIQPQATHSVAAPSSPHVPYHEGHPSGTSSHCVSCGALACLLFGCGVAGPGACGLFACDGGCGIGFCGGGCGPTACGPGCGEGDCEQSGGGGGTLPPADDLPGGEDADCEEPEEAEVCTEYVGTPSGQVTQTTETDCHTTTGCSVEASTTTTTLGGSCPLLLPVLGDSYGSGDDAFPPVLYSGAVTTATLTFSGILASIYASTYVTVLSPVPTRTSPAPPLSTPSRASTSTSSTTSPVGPPTGTSVPGYDYLGCYTDADIRTLNQVLDQDDGMTLENCATFCEQGGWSMFGVENGNQCWCADEINPDSTAALSPDSDCDVPCAGDAAEICGAPWFINVYRKQSSSPALGITLYWEQTVRQAGGGPISTSWMYEMFPNSDTPCDNVEFALFTADAGSSSSAILTGEFAFTTSQGFQCTWSNSDSTQPGSVQCLSGAGEISVSQCSLANASEQGCVFTGESQTTYIAQVVC